MKEATKIIREARAAQVHADLSQLGRLVNLTETETERGTILGMLAIEIALRKRNINLAIHVLNMAKRRFPDDFINLKITVEQEKFIHRFIRDPDFAQKMIVARSRLFSEGKL